MLIAGPPAYGTAQQWSNERELAWARESVAWLRELVGPESCIVTAALHRDETSPHVQAVIVPVHEGRLGWTAVRNAAAARALAIGTTDPERAGRSKYSTLQDDYQARVGRRFALGRGRVGSEATHEAIDRAAAVEAREVRARQSTDRLERSAEQYREAVGAGSDRVVQLEERERELRREVNVLEADRKQARERRDEEARILVAARELREREEAIAGSLITGRRSRHGRVLIAEFEGRIAVAERQRDVNRAAADTAIEERDAARTGCREAHARAVQVAAERDDLKAERDALREQVPDPVRQAQVAQRNRDFTERQTVDAARRGLYQGLVYAGNAFASVLDALHLNISAYPRLSALLGALRRGDVEAVDEAVEGAQPARAAPARVRSGLER